MAKKVLPSAELMDRLAGAYPDAKCALDRGTRSAIRRRRAQECGPVDRTIAGGQNWWPRGRR